MTALAMTAIGALLADQTRASLLLALLDGRAWTAGELARHASVAPSTASEHLSRLLDARFVTVVAQGRHRYYQLAGPEVAELLESLGQFELSSDAPGRTGPRAPSEMLHARSCYDHLAGRLGVEIYERLLADGRLTLTDDALALAPAGEALLSELGADVNALYRVRRPVARTCLDWTERRPHLAGAAGAALFGALLERRWVIRGSRPRSIVITGAGQRGLSELIGISGDSGMRRR